MDAKIKELYIQLRNDTAAFMIYQDRNIIKKTYPIMSVIQEFSEWFMQENQFGIEEEEYLILCRNLVSILEDLLVAIEQNDVVLMNDALAYGMLDYLKLFCDVEEGEEER